MGKEKEKEKEKKNENVENGSYNYKMFNLFNRKFKINEVEPPGDVKKTFMGFTDGANYMIAEQLKCFLVSNQGEVDSTLQDAQRIVEEVVNRREHVTKFAIARHSLNLDDFFHYLCFDDLNGPIRTQVIIFLNFSLNLSPWLLDFYTIEYP